jgi:hypothetical protein
MMLKLKRNETRGWSTNVRGRIGIHATANMPGWCKELCRNPELPIMRALLDHGLVGSTLPRGAILGTLEIVGCISSEEWLQKNDYRANDEFHFGDYSPGRFAWQTDNVIAFDDPIPAKGRQGFWNYDFTPFLSGQL